MHQNSIVLVQFEGKKVTSEILLRGVLIVIIYAFSLMYSFFGVVLCKDALLLTGCSLTWNKHIGKWFMNSQEYQQITSCFKSGSQKVLFPSN